MKVIQQPMLRVFYFLLGFAVLTGSVHAAPPLVLAEEQHLYPIALHLDVLEDPDGQWTLKQVSSLAWDTRFAANTSNTTNFGV
ncbi:MAG: hypothetical protein AAF512_20615, partial [Pseudomonadota bacterium]